MNKKLLVSLFGGSLFPHGSSATARLISSLPILCALLGLGAGCHRIFDYQSPTDNTDADAVSKSLDSGAAALDSYGLLEAGFDARPLIDASYNDAMDGGAGKCSVPLIFTDPGCQAIEHTGVSSAFSSEVPNSASWAIDQNCSTYWKSIDGDWQEWRIDFGAVKKIRGLTLAAGPLPSFATSTTLKIYTSVDDTSYLLYGQLEMQTMKSEETYSVDFRANINVRYIKINSSFTPYSAWVSWREITFFTCQ